jgi:hypothetical protein
MPSIVFAVFLLAHGLIHASFISPAPAPAAAGPEWPFSFERSWLLSPLGVGPALAHGLGVVLLLAVVAGYIVGALAVVGVIPGSWFAPALVIATVASAVLLGLFFHPWLVLGLVIDGLLLVALARGWTPGAVA